MFNFSGIIIIINFSGEIIYIPGVLERSTLRADIVGQQNRYLKKKSV